MKKSSIISESDLEERTTEDGSKTLIRKKSGLSYRSTHGALKESTEVFVQGAKLETIAEEWSVFELGFGTGMNFTTTLSLAKRQGVRLRYEAVDHLPVPPSFSACEWTKMALKLVRNKKESITIKIPLGTLTLHPHSFLETSINKEFDAIFHDPFGPGANPECWTMECFKKEYQLLKQNGIWTSYGASGAMRRALAEVGLYVAVGPGIGRKRETTRASKSVDSLFPYKIKYKPTT